GRDAFLHRRPVSRSVSLRGVDRVPRLLESRPRATGGIPGGLRPVQGRQTGGNLGDICRPRGRAHVDPALGACRGAGWVALYRGGREREDLAGGVSQGVARSEERGGGVSPGSAYRLEEGA